MKIDMSVIKKYRYAIAYITSILLIGCIAIIFTDRKANTILREYPKLYLHDSISGRVSDIYTTNWLRHGAGIMVDIDSRKLTICVSEYDIPGDFEISKYLEIGDYVYKAAGNDSVIILDGKTLQLKYKYVLRE